VALDGRYTRQDDGAGSTGARPGTNHGATVRWARLSLDGAIRQSGEIDDLACDCCATDVAMTDAGPVATWRSRTPDEIRDVAVAWYAAPNRQARVQLAWSTDGGASFGPAVLVADADVSGRVDVVLLADDSAIVSWLARRPEGGGQILMRRVPPAGAPGAVRVIAQGEVSRAGGLPRMVATANRPVYAWTEPGEPSRVLAA
jgi:hypothetical protein